ncbi:MAG: glycosyltransferase [Bradymonadales bacterium]|jgi:hypothetical protein
MTAENAELSIVVAIHNQESAVARIINSLLERLDAEYPGKFEIILVDQASTDNSQASIIALANQRSLIRLNRIDSPIDGLSLKRGLEAAISAHVVWCRLEDCHFDTVWSLYKALGDADIVLSHDDTAQKQSIRAKVKGIACKVAKKALSFSPDQCFAPMAIKVPALNGLSYQIDAHRSNFVAELLLRAHKKGLQITEIAAESSPKSMPIAQLPQNAAALGRAIFRARFKKDA